MHLINPPESIKELTRLYTGERFPDGRPRVSDDILERMKAVTTEQAWGVLRRNDSPPVKSMSPFGEKISRPIIRRG